MYKERATMLAGSKLPRPRIGELLTLNCPPLMYSSLLVVTETFTDKEPSTK